MQKEANVPQPGLYFMTAEVPGEQTTETKLTGPVLFCCPSAQGERGTRLSRGVPATEIRHFPPPSLFAGFYVQNHFILHLDKHMSQSNKDSYIPHQHFCLQCVFITAAACYPQKELWC